MPLRWQASKGKDVRFTFTKDELLGECPSGKKRTQVECQKALIKCYENAGRKWLMCRVELWQNEMRLFAKKISVRSQKTRWGSCSSEGCISLNWRLLAAPLPVMDYVVIHELAHLKFHDHSQQFWNLVAQYDSQYKYHRKWLREHQWAFDFLALKSELHIGSI